MIYCGGVCVVQLVTCPPGEQCVRELEEPYDYACVPILGKVYFKTLLIDFFCYLIKQNWQD